MNPCEFMNPCEINVAITAITNHFYCNLSRDEFLNLGVFLSLLSKDMLAMSTIEELCRWEERRKNHHHHHHKKDEREKKAE